MIAIVWFQTVLSWFGWILAEVYKVIPNYGITILLVTLAVRVLLLPLGIKQIRSMHAMQQIQPKIKQLQQKYKGNREKLNQEMMALYKEHGYNPLSGCLPMLLQLPVLILLYSVLVVPKGIPHLPVDSQLRTAIVQQDSSIYFLGMNMTCTAVEAGRGTVRNPPGTKPSQTYGLVHRDCGSGIPIRIPYYLLALVMVGTQYYQQRQMQRANPATDTQQQMLTRFMPIIFGVWGFIFPMGLVVYWTTTNIVQVAQQHFMLPRKGETPPPLKPGKEDRANREDRQPGGKGRTEKRDASAKASSPPRARQQRPPRKGGGSRGGVVPRARAGGERRGPVGGPSKSGGGKGAGDAGDREQGT